VLAQIFAEELDLPIEDVIVYAADTDITPFDKGAYASSTTYCSGMAVLKTARAIKKQVLAVASEMLGEPEADLEVKSKGVESKRTGKRVEYHEIAKRALYVRKQFQIAASESFASPLPPQSYSAHFVEVEVDTETGEIRVPLYVVAVDCGTAINPKLAEGQAEGAVLNGISYALYERYVWDESGRLLNPSFGGYRIATAREAPEIKTVLVPSYEPSGPWGAKSIGEVCVNGPLPAISNAVYHAVGVRLRESPFTPDRVLRAIQERSRKR
jgi:CO/xanthine dehydrogenase Mo-binding subunit